MISKNFHHVLRISERQPLIGPPESMREHVVQASKAMKRGEWKACKNYLINEKMNLKVNSCYLLPIYLIVYGHATVFVYCLSAKTQHQH